MATPTSSNDPLLQGRLFSYLGTTNFHQIPINAPKRPLHNFQRDGLMQTLVPTGRANYEPNSLAAAGEDGGPRACPETGFSSFAGDDEHSSSDHQKLRIRAPLFADHYSQARLFYRSQTESEQAHLASALVFELPASPPWVKTLVDLSKKTEITPDTWQP